MINEEREEKIKIQNRFEEFEKLEKRYLKKMNIQQEKMKLIKKLLDQQAEKNIELYRMNKKLQQKFLYYTTNKKITDDEIEDLQKLGLIDEEAARKVEEWLELKHREIEQVKIFLIFFRLIFITLSKLKKKIRIIKRKEKRLNF